DAVALPFEEGEESLADFLAAERPWLGRHFRSPRFAGQITPRSTLVNEGDLPLAVLAHHLHRNGLVSAADEEGGAVLRLRLNGDLVDGAGELHVAEGDAPGVVGDDAPAFDTAFVHDAGELVLGAAGEELPRRVDLARLDGADEGPESTLGRIGGGLAGGEK